MLNFTASPLKSVPSWNLTPWRSVNCRVVESLYCQAVASPGLIFKDGSMVTSESYML